MFWYCMLQTILNLTSLHLTFTYNHLLVIDYLVTGALGSGHGRRSWGDGEAYFPMELDGGILYTISPHEHLIFSQAYLHFQEILLTVVIVSPSKAILGEFLTKMVVLHLDSATNYTPSSPHFQRWIAAHGSGSSRFSCQGQHVLMCYNLLQKWGYFVGGLFNCS